MRTHCKAREKEIKFYKFDVPKPANQNHYNLNNFLLNAFSEVYKVTAVLQMLYLVLST